MPEELPPPYLEIYSQLMDGKIIPFLGAGAPLFTRNPKQTSWMTKENGKDVISFLPTASELANYLGSRTNVPADERGELTRMAQYFHAIVGAQALRQRLREIFSFNQPPTPLHEFLASVPKPLLIVTTNYDDLLERAFAAAGKPYDVVVHLTEPQKVHWWRHGAPKPEEVLASDLLADVDAVTVIYKIHGAVDRRDKQTGQYVITEDDYIEFLTRMTRGTVIPAIFAEPFQTRPFLFLGYGLYDWNMRVILNRIQDFRGRPEHVSWAIETLHKPMEQKLWEKRGVALYDGLSLEKFLAELKKQGEAGN